MGQLGFFDLNRRYESLTEKKRSACSDCGDGSVRILAAKVNAALIKGELRRSEAERKNSAGRKPWDEVVIFKALVCRRSTISPTIRWNTSFVIASPSCAFSVWSWRMRFRRQDFVALSRGAGQGGRGGRAVRSV